MLDAFGNPVPGTDGNGSDPPPPQSPSRYNDMTPGVPPRSILNTSWKNTGSAPEPWDEGDPSRGTVLSRIGAAASNAFANAPSQGTEPGNTSILSTGTQDAINRTLGPVGGAVANFVPRVIGTGIGDVAALGAGSVQAGRELLTALGASGATQRNLTALAAALPWLAPELNAMQFGRAPAARPDAAAPNVAPALTPDAVAAARARAEARPAPTGLLGQPAEAPPSTPTNIPGPMPPPAGYVPPAPRAITPTTAGEMKPVATFLLDKARASGADLTPDYTNNFVDKVTADAMPAGPGTAAVAGPNDPVTAMVQRLQGLKNQPLSIKDVMGMDEELNARKRAVINTDPDLARRLGGLQDALRAQVNAATSDDVGGGADGWQAFSDGRAAYSQYKKMQTLEDIRDKAMGMEQPATAMQSNITKWATDPKKLRGLSDTEIDALKDAGERGYMGELVRSAGGRLAVQTASPMVGAIAGAMTPFPVLGPIVGGIAGKAAESVISTAVRNAGVKAQIGRVSDALKTLGSTVKVPPDMPWPPSAAP